MELLLTIIAVPVLNYLVQRGKKRWNLEGQVVLVLFAVLLGVVYVAFQMIMPDMLEQQVYDFVTSVGMRSVLVYEFFIRKIG